MTPTVKTWGVRQLSESFKTGPEAGVLQASGGDSKRLRQWVYIPVGYTPCRCRSRRRCNAAVQTVSEWSKKTKTKPNSLRQ